MNGIKDYSFKKALLTSLVLVLMPSPTWSQENKDTGGIQDQTQSQATPAVELKSLRPIDNLTLARNPWGFFEFWWQGPDKDGPYTLQISADPEFKDLVYFQTVNRFHDFTRHLPDQGKFYWRVLYKDQSTAAKTLNIVKPKDGKIKIDPAKVVESDLESNTKGYITLKWHGKNKVGPYDVEISPDKDFSKLVFSERVRATNFRFESFAEAGQFYWRVRMGRIISPTGRFTINEGMVRGNSLVRESTLPLATPEDGQTIYEGRKVNLRWKDLGKEAEYYIRISRKSDFSELLFEKKVNRNELSISQKLETGTYYWQVKSSRFESPVQSFVVSERPDVFSQGLNLMRKLFIDSGKKSYYLSADYRLSTLEGSDFSNSTSGILAANQFINLELGFRKNLFPTWDFEAAANYSLIDRQEPEDFELRNPVSGLFGIQAGVENRVLTDFRAGIFLRYSEFEMIKEIAGSFFEMTSRPALSAGAHGKYNLISWSDTNIWLGTTISAALPAMPDIQSAFVADYYLAGDFHLSDNFNGEVRLFFQNMGVISEFSSQNSRAAGVRFTIWLD